MGELGWETEQILEPETQAETIANAEVPLEAVASTSQAPANDTDTETLTDQVVLKLDVESSATTQTGVSVILSHTDSPSDFYLQISDALDEINSLQNMLQEQMESLPIIENVTVGVLCAAPYSGNQQWYRADILDGDDDITTVRFVDYGNTDVLTNSTTSVRALPAELLALAHHARRCSLMYKPLDEEWPATAFELFDDFTREANLTAEIVHQDEKLTYVELFANGVDIGDVLMKEGLAVKLQLEADSSCMGYVSHYNSPSEFWIQMENSCGDLEWVAEQLAGAESYPELHELNPGSLCAAIFSEDELWYRARILSNTVAGIFFI